MREREFGFTLLELMITVVIVVVLLAIVAPAMREILLNNRQATDHNEMLTSLTLARAEAVKRGVRTRVCISDATPDCDSAATRWEDGWIVLADIDADGTITTADGDLILESHGGLTGGTTLRSNGAVVNSVVYNARGFSSARTMRLCDSRGAGEARGIIISNTGRPRRALDTNGDGTAEGGDGNNLTCP